MGKLSKKRIKKIEDHIKNDDLLGTQATVVSCMKQDFAKGCLEREEEWLQWLEQLSEDLDYLQQNYTLVKKRMD